MEFYRKYMLVFITAHATALMALSAKEDVSERVTYENLMLEEIRPFKSFVENKIENIIRLWVNPETHTVNCVKTAEKYLDDTDRVGWEFTPGPYEWGRCKMIVPAQRGPNVQSFCQMFGESISNPNHEQHSSIENKATDYWQPYQNKLVGSNSVFRKVEEMVGNGTFENKLLQEIKKKVKEEFNVEKIPDDSVASVMETDD